MMEYLKDYTRPAQYKHEPILTKECKKQTQKLNKVFLQNHVKHCNCSVPSCDHPVITDQSDTWEDLVLKCHMQEYLNSTTQLEREAHMEAVMQHYHNHKRIKEI